MLLIFDLKFIYRYEIVNGNRANIGGIIPHELNDH